MADPTAEVAEATPAGIVNPWIELMKTPPARAAFFFFSVIAEDQHSGAVTNEQLNAVTRVSPVWSGRDARLSIIRRTDLAGFCLFLLHAYDRDFRKAFLKGRRL